MPMSPLPNWARGSSLAISVVSPDIAAVVSSSSSPQAARKAAAALEPPASTRKRRRDTGSAVTRANALRGRSISLVRLVSFPGTLPGCRSGVPTRPPAGSDQKPAGRIGLADFGRDLERADLDPGQDALHLLAVDGAGAEVLGGLGPAGD